MYRLALFILGCGALVLGGCAPQGGKKPHHDDKKPKEQVSCCANC